MITTSPPPSKYHQAQMALPVPAELAAGWLDRATGAGGCDEHTGNDITGWLSETLAAEIRPMLLLTALTSPAPSPDGIFLPLAEPL